MKKHILVISQYFFPEQFRINDICAEWIKRGYRVTVLTGIPNYPRGKFFKGYGLFRKRRELIGGIDVIRLPLIPRGNNAIQLVLNYLTFAMSGFWWQLFTSLRADFVFIFEVSPMTQALPGVWYARRRKVPCYLYVQDLWPENVEIVSGITNKLIINSIGRMVDYIYARCTRIFTSSQSFVEAIAARGTDGSKLEYWPQFAEDFYQPLPKNYSNVPEISSDGIANLTFAGNIGYAQGLDVLIDAAMILKARRIAVRFNMIGDGRYRDTFMSKIKNSEIDEMFNFIGRQSPERIPEFLAVSDAALITLSDNKVLTATIPAKTQSCLACGVPIIASGNGEIRKVIHEAHTGFCSDAGDGLGLADNIQKFLALAGNERADMARNASNYYNINFSKNILMNRMDSYLN